MTIRSAGLFFAKIRGLPPTDTTHTTVWMLQPADAAAARRLSGTSPQNVLEAAAVAAVLRGMSTSTCLWCWFSVLVSRYSFNYLKVAHRIP